MKNYSFDSSKAFINTFELKPYKQGALDGLTFAVKDNIDVAGFKTSYGSKPWLASHPKAVSHAVCVEQLLIAGASCVGKTISDELTHSLDGEGFFYGTPVNPKAPEHIPGVSSSGSASAVACGLVDFAIGTDSAGSIRVPASHCGILGMRPTINRISESGVLPFAPSSSTVGILANKLTILEKVMTVLLSSDEKAQRFIDTIYLLEDAFSLADQEVKESLQITISRLRQINNIQILPITLSEIIGENVDLLFWREKIFSSIQCVEMWNSVGSWIEADKPEMGARIKEGMEHHKYFDRSNLNEALRLKERMFLKMCRFMELGKLVCFPTVPMIAPLKGELDDQEKCMDYYMRTMNITSFAGVACLPEITIPVAEVRNIPLGLSLVASTRQDEFLISAAKTLFPEFL